MMGSDVSRFSEETESILVAAGWKPGRRVDVSAWRDQLEGRGLTMHDAAERFLQEFGGMDVRASGSGVTSAKEPFQFDPTLALGEEDSFELWSRRSGHSLFPLGELDRGRFFLGIDEEGEIYLVSGWLARFGKFDAGLESLARGIMAEDVPWDTSRG
jgi:hypothetical protein